MGTKIQYPNGEGSLFLIDVDEVNIFEFFSSVEVRSVKEAKEVWPLLEDNLLDKHYFDVEEDIEAIFMHYAKTTGLDVAISKYIKALQQPKAFEIEVETETDYSNVKEEHGSMWRAYVDVNPTITDNKLKILKHSARSIV